MSYRLFVPSDSVLGEFQSAVAPMNEKRLLLIEESARLASLRDTLLPKLIYGALRVNSELEI